MAACNPATEAHRDAVLLVEYLMDHRGSSSAPQDEIARALGMMVERKGMREVDRSRYQRARRHVHERYDSNGRPCCGFRLHYRRAGRDSSSLVLVDPSGDLGHHARAVVASVEGYVSRKRQHTTEDANMVETFRAVADHAMSQGDLDGARLMLAASIDIERHGSIAPATMGEVEMWLAT